MSRWPGCIVSDWELSTSTEAIFQMGGSRMRRFAALVTGLVTAAFLASATLPTSSIAQEVPCGDPMGCGGDGGGEGGAPCTNGSIRKTYLCDFCRYETQWVSFPTHYLLIWQGDGTVISKTCQNGTWGSESWTGVLCGACNVR